MLLLALVHWRRMDEAGTATRLEVADRNFAIIEVVLLVLFLASIAIAGTIGEVLGLWIVLWIVVVLGIAMPLGLSRSGLVRRGPILTAPVIALLGMLALRAVIIFAPQL